jgi:glycosyltransferase involved in cell wall biosynthesis
MKSQTIKLSRKPKLLFVGCSGYGNTGDDIYPRILKKYLGDFDLYFVNSDPPRLVSKDITAVVIGPGGMIYEDNSSHFEYIAEFMNAAIVKRKKLIFLSCGIQSLDISRWKTYFDYASLITVRSQKDLDKIKELTTNKNTFYFPDLAYLFQDYEPVPNIPKSYAIFSPVNPPSLSEKKIFRSYKPEQRVLVRMGSLKDTRKVFQLWQKLGRCVTFPHLSPAQVNYVFTHANSSYTARYHGIILSRINTVAHRQLDSDYLKVKFEDISSDYTSAIFHIRQLQKVCTQNQVQKPKIAILHDDFTLCGGGEVLISTLAHEFQKNGFEADIYTFDISKETKKIIHPDIRVHTLRIDESIENVDYMKRYLFASLHISAQYDFFIFSGHCSISAAQKHKPNLLYAHNIPLTQPKFPKKHNTQTLSILSQIISRQPVAATKIVLKKNENTSSQPVPTQVTKALPLFEQLWTNLHQAKLKILKKPILPFFIAHKIDTMRYYFVLKKQEQTKISFFKLLSYQKTHDQNMKHIQHVVTNSQNIQQKFYKRFHKKSKVVYPPIDTNTYQSKPHKNYWISINRIVPAKRIELQLQALKMLPREKLIIIGDIEDKNYYDYLQDICPKNVTFSGVISQDEKITLLSESIGLIFTAEDEDFGMAVVEAMASGKPVIAPKSGGCIETVKDGLTGLLLSPITPKKIVLAMQKIKQNPGHYTQFCLDRARKFDTTFFTKAIIDQIPK